LIITFALDSPLSLFPTWLNLDTLASWNWRDLLED
jgi:hypothetical protein